MISVNLKHSSSPNIQVDDSWQVKHRHVPFSTKLPSSHARLVSPQPSGFSHVPTTLHKCQKQLPCHMAYSKRQPVTGTPNRCMIMLPNKQMFTPESQTAPALPSSVAQVRAAHCRCVMQERQ